MKETISVIGTGNMGAAISERLIRCGYDVTIFNRTAERLQSLVAIGAKVAGTAVEAINASEFAMIVLLDEKAIREAVVNGLGDADISAKRLMSVSYTSLNEIISLEKTFNRSGARLSEVSIMGYPDQILAAEARFVLAGPRQDFDSWLGIFMQLGQRVDYVGECGNATKAEMANWLSYALQMISIAYPAAVYKREGLPLSVLSGIFTDNPNKRIPGADVAISSMGDREYKPRFTVGAFLASIDIVIDYTRSQGMPASLYEGVREVYQLAADRGLGNSDVSAIFEVLYDTSGLHSQSSLGSGPNNWLPKSVQG
ncbi:NAD(P)-binding domain-containing protein [Rhizobium sp. NZLR11]|uniref:NAD(P)-dependent oxidoreductase n=1 Tax=Rhizobium sp. NZLR11 TaxID=2731098 RepID=UPI001C82E43A|nr:NAD(P)-binding domain-containing protein [Rhizobium sp. NZLR11]MBX5210514.1 NAD(P)-dependent oxidoreductase [Rhizobium sp. NZLR11]